MKFCHIAPTLHLSDFCSEQTHHLLLAHLVEEDDRYADWYKTRRFSDGWVYILDNSAFEKFKRGEPMYPSDKLIEMGNRVGADYIVMSDYPNEQGQKTIDKAIEMAPKLRASGFGTFFVPQSKIGDLDDLVAGFKWASEAPEVDYIGLSILAIPNAYGVERNNKLQRFLSRWSFLHRLQQEGVLDVIRQNGKKIHCLGLVDGYKEIELVGSIFKNFIDTWDSSAAIWYGLNGIMFDTSPSGALHGKFEQEVDFKFYREEATTKSLVRNNIMKIEELCQRY